MLLKASGDNSTSFLRSIFKPGYDNLVVILGTVFASMAGVSAVVVSILIAQEKMLLDIEEEKCHLAEEAQADNAGQGAEKSVSSESQGDTETASTTGTSGESRTDESSEVTETSEETSQGAADNSRVQA
ncbi:hypothetical protein ElyMa_005894300 [Elysia marginata]|uniref:Nematode cuticle collagen N-terminal domain-containing protein n=1 Tax=Elysia marginata TaxID=1093978 RepID=A0AAV4G6F1_9GAST|nr:hypothetical protein ElyMa_005894300 [Elysia marginata]